MAAFVLALIRVRSVNLAQIAGAHRLQLPPLPEVPGRVQLRPGNHRTADPAQNPEQKLVLSLDRTEWKLGRRSINLLFIGVAHQGVAYPLVGCFLGKAGSSNLRERLGLLRRLLTFLPKARIVRIGSLPSPAFCATCAGGKCPTPCASKRGAGSSTRATADPSSGCSGIWGSPAQTGSAVGATHLLRKGEYPLLTEADSQQAPARYARRWEIETLFKQNPGLRLRIHPRVESLIAWMSIALVWAHQVGEWLSRTKPIPIKTHARKLYSTFRYGLDYLRQLIFAAEVRKDELYACMRLLSCT